MQLQPLFSVRKIIHWGIPSPNVKFGWRYMLWNTSFFRPFVFTTILGKFKEYSRSFYKPVKFKGISSTHEICNWSSFQRITQFNRILSTSNTTYFKTFDLNCRAFLCLPLLAQVLNFLEPRLKSLQLRFKFNPTSNFLLNSFHSPW